MIIIIITSIQILQVIKPIIKVLIRKKCIGIPIMISLDNRMNQLLIIRSYLTLRKKEETDIMPF